MQITEKILLESPFLKRLIELALDEDLHGGDSTSDAVLHASVMTRTNFVTKADGVVAGLFLVPFIIDIARQKGYVHGEVGFKTFVDDGDVVPKNKIIAEMQGDIKNVLRLERTLLNFISRISGVATCTRQMVDVLAQSKAKIFDTRKTLPGWRILDKYAVSKGGGQNHRLDLSEHVLIKDNHIEGDSIGVLNFLTGLSEHKTSRKKVEIEIDNFEYFECFEKELWNADIIMLDNMNITQLKKAIDLIRSKETELNKKFEIEISGGLTIEDLKKMSSFDVDRISVGRITHSAPSLDISLDVKI